MADSTYTNIAFISYKREDEKWAKWLQKRLEYYELPTEIRKKYPDLEFLEHPRHVFKDTTDLSGGVLAKAIKVGLDSSKFLIVICSPRAAKSEWVCKEVQDFIDAGREEYIIPFIVDGEPYAKNTEQECFPTSLKALAGDRELLGININENGREAAAVKVAARMFGLNYDSLWQRFKREERKRKRNVFAIFILTIIVLLSIIAYGIWANLQITSERDRANIANKQLLSANYRISKQTSELQRANDSISKQKISLQKAFDNLSKTEKALSKSNVDLIASNKLLKVEKQNALNANKKNLIQRSVEYGNLAYRYIEEGKIPEAEDLLQKIIPNNENLYIYTPEMERAIRRYYNCFEQTGIKLVENKELSGSIYDFPPFLKEYGFIPKTTKYEEIDSPSNNEAAAVFNQNNDTLIVINEELTNAIISKNENNLLGYRNDSIFIWNIDKKCCIFKHYLHDGIRDIKIIDNNKICILGKSYFSIYKFNSFALELESETEIQNEPKIWKKEYGNFGNIPFVVDDKNRNIIYQRNDSCLIIQQIGSNNVIVDRKIDGFIESIALSQNNFPCLALTYKKEFPLSIYDMNRNGEVSMLMLLHYPSLLFLYDKKYDGYIKNLAFSTTNYLGALVGPSKQGVTQLYIWDMLNPVKYDQYGYFNLSKTISVNPRHFENIKFITNKGYIVYLKKSIDSNQYNLCLKNLFSNRTDTLLTTNNGYSIDAKSSLDGNFIVYYDWEMGVWLYDTQKGIKKKISNDNFRSFRSIDISLDGSTIAYMAFRKVGGSSIIIYDIKNASIRQYPSSNGYGLSLNYDGTKLLFSDYNHIIHEYDLKSQTITTVSVPCGSNVINRFGYSKSGKYMYQIYDAEMFNEENKRNTYIKIWTSKRHELIMENIIKPTATLFLDDINNIIYRTSINDSEIIPFKKLDILIQNFRKSNNEIK